MMKHTLYLVILVFILFESCAQEAKQERSLLKTTTIKGLDVTHQKVKDHVLIDPAGTIIETRILAPEKFQRTIVNENSFAYYLRNLPLKPHGSEVMLYDGTIKPNYETYDAVLDLRIGTKDLHQCADAVMRLRAEYLWNQKRYADIHFNFTNGFRVDYTNWMEGKRVVVKGNDSYWLDKYEPSNTYQDFWNYMEVIFSYAGTLSLSKELITVKLEDLKIGDVFIWGGSPGHAVLVIDIAENSINKEKIILLAQSYMPAQEIQILQNPNNSKLSPWYAVSEIGEQLKTPEWIFSRKDFKRFK